MILYCYGEPCPLRDDCYRHTQPSRGRDAFGSVPYDAVRGTCDHFYSNVPSEALVRETAYYLWQRSGCPVGRSTEHWDAAYLSLCQSSGRKVSR